MARALREEAPNATATSAGTGGNTFSRAESRMSATYAGSVGAAPSQSSSRSVIDTGPAQEELDALLAPPATTVRVAGPVVVKESRVMPRSSVVRIWPREKSEPLELVTRTSTPGSGRPLRLRTRTITWAWPPPAGRRRGSVHTVSVRSSPTRATGRESLAGDGVGSGGVGAGGVACGCSGVGTGTPITTGGRWVAAQPRTPSPARLTSTSAAAASTWLQLRRMFIAALHSPRP